MRAELDVLRAHLAGRDPGDAQDLFAGLRATATQPSRLDDVESGFGLSRFERSVLLLAAGSALVGEVRTELIESTGAAELTFAAALAALPNAHWDAVTPQSPLRYWGLLDVADATSPLTSALHPDESVLHYLVGVDAPDEALMMLSQPVEVPLLMPPSFREVAAAIVDQWESPRPVALRGPQTPNVRLIAAAACQMAGFVPRCIAASDLPSRGDDLARLLRRMTRQTVLAQWAWVIEATDANRTEADGLARAAGTFDAPSIILLGEGPRDAGTRWPAPVMTVPRLGVGERNLTWMAVLQAVGADVPEAEVATIAAAYDMAVPEILGVAHDVAQGAAPWSACRRRQRIDMGGLARVRTARAGWDDLVLPEAALDQIRGLVAAVRNRIQVLDEWGFAARNRGLGTTALFAGPSGTGKTLAAEVVAHELDLDLVQVDLSQVVNKYIGETEKHLAALFDAAENGGMVLLFDEADALFGKRTEVKDSHDRYANVEVGYLLQRLESFTGVAILTTNARNTLDRAFTRRLTSIVTFPYPDAAARHRLWHVNLPEAMPRGDLDLGRLARTDLSGGEIAAAALQGAYLAADADVPVGMDHLIRASRGELGKSGRTAPRDRS